MTGFLEDTFLRSMFGLTDAEIATINARLPDLQNLIAVVQSHVPQINRVATDLLPIVQKIIAKERELK